MIWHFVSKLSTSEELYVDANTDVNDVLTRTFDANKVNNTGVL
jgi:hypothetical protein